MNPYAAPSIPARPHAKTSPRWFQLAAIVVIIVSLATSFICGIWIGQYYGWQEGYENCYRTYSGLK